MPLNKNMTRKKLKPRHLAYYFLIFVMAFAMASCFTGIESTKKISMSREDKKKSAPSSEELFFEGIKGAPLKNWKKGREFIVTDDKAILIFEILDTSFYPDVTSLKGKSLYYNGVQYKMDAAGNLTTAIIFTDGISNMLYDSGKSKDLALENFKSDELPMLIDKELVNQANNLLKGKTLWTKTNLWYNDKEERIDGKKYVEVVVDEVEPGNMVFPLLVKLSTPSGENFHLFMNLGNSATESRSFHNLFSLTDIKKHYPDVSPEFWDLICNSRVAEGMTKLECRLALGNPIEINSGHDYSQTLDIWTYDNGKILWFEDGRLVRHKG